MKSRRLRHFIIIFFAALYLFFLIFKLIVTLENADFVDINARNALKIENLIGEKSDYSFIAVGNVMNSTSIFQDKMIPMINESSADFLVFTGNFLLDGGNDKYAALNRMLTRLNKPALFVFGDREASDRGSGHFFLHMGNPYFFFTAGDSLFLFMDTTGFSDETAQLVWLKEILYHFEVFPRRFIFMNRSLLLDSGRSPAGESKYILSEEYGDQLKQIFSGSGVSAVISSSSGPSDIGSIDGTDYIATGGGGGAIVDEEEKGFYYTEVNISGPAVEARNVNIPADSSLPGIRLFRWIWNRIVSWVHVAFLNIILVISILFVIIYRLYSLLVMRIEYYPDFSSLPEKGYPLTIAMFTNNYLPFVGGVPLSIARLKKGLEEKGHKVYIFAPAYEGSSRKEEDGVIRFSPLFHYRKGELIVPVSNIFSLRIRREFRRIDPDIVHVHHPFWLGSVGRRLAWRYGKPVVFTYHTRLEHYNHYVPLFRRLAGGQIPHMLIKYFASRCDAVIAPTTSARQYLRNLGIGKLIVVQPTGIDLKENASAVPEAMKESAGPVLFSVYRLSSEKSPFFMLEGIESLSGMTDIPFRCFIAGTGPEETLMRTFIKSRGLEDRIVLLGKVDPNEIRGYYRGADIFVFSSQSETQGMVILEAMAEGKPVVAVDSSGISDIVVNDVNGYKTAADEKIWTEKIQRLIEDDELRKRLGEGALKTAAANSLESMCTNILDMYYEIIDWKEKHPDKVFIR